MNTRNISIAAMAAILILGMSAMAFAGPGYGRGTGTCGGPGYGMGNAYSQLSPEKQQAVDAIYAKYDDKFDAIRTQLWTKHSVLQAMINGGNADEKKISGLVADITKLRDQMQETRDALRADLEKETGLVGFGGRGFGRGQGMGQGMGQGYGRGMGSGQGQGYGQGNCLGAGPCWN